MDKNCKNSGSLALDSSSKCSLLAAPQQLILSHGANQHHNELKLEFHHRKTDVKLKQVFSHIIDNYT